MVGSSVSRKVGSGVATVSIVAVASSKGGAGKTTVAEVLLGALAERGATVAAIDADFNQTLSKWVQTFSSYPITATVEIDETKIVPLAGKLADQHDVVVIDTAGAATQATVFAIGCADLVIVPVQLSSSDVVEAIKTVGLVKSAAEMTRQNIPARVLLTDYQPNTNIANHIEAEIKRYGLPMFNAKLNRLVAFKEMTFTGDVPASGRAGEQVEKLIQELKALGVLPCLA